ncbi:MAG: hypothetical protein ABR574_05180 [Cryomorphaceae bacterium]
MNNQKALSFLRSKFPFHPEVAVIDYTSNNAIREELQVERSVPYRDIPYESGNGERQGELVLGTVNGRKTLLLSGYFNTGSDESFAVEVMNHFGIKSVILTLRALSLYNSPGPEMLIASDHFTLFNSFNPLQKNGKTPQLAREIYPSALIETAKSEAQKLGMRIPDGTLCEGIDTELVSNAEYEYLRACGIDAIGSSFSRDSVAAYRAGIPMLILALLQEPGLDEKQSEMSSEKDLRKLILGIISSL